LYLASAEGVGTHTFDVRNMLRNWGETTATWNTYDGTNNWTTAGGLGAATDRVSTAVAQITGVTSTPGFFTVTQTSGGLFDLAQAQVTAGLPLSLHVERNGTGEDATSKLFDSSDGTNGQRPYFELTYTTSTGTITVTQPTTGAHIFPGQSIPIRWQTQGVSGNLSVKVSRDGGHDFETLHAGYPYDASDFVWTVTAGKSGTAIFRVCSVNDPTVCGDSAAVTIAGTYLTIR